MWVSRTRPGAGGRGRAWDVEGQGGPGRTRMWQTGGQPLLSSSCHLLCLLISPPPFTLSLFSPGAGLLRKEFVLTTRDQENVGGWPGVVTTAVKGNGRVKAEQPSAHTSAVGKPFLAWRWAAERKLDLLTASPRHSQTHPVSASPGRLLGEVDHSTKRPPPPCPRDSLGTAAVVGAGASAGPARAALSSDAMESAAPPAVGSVCTSALLSCRPTGCQHPAASLLHFPVLMLPDSTQLAGRGLVR